MTKCRLLSLELVEQLPNETVSLRELAALRTAARVQLARTTEPPESVAGWLNDLSNRLGYLGRREPALAAIEEAVKSYRRLAEARADAFLPDLATSLNNLSIGLRQLGPRERALKAIAEAVGIGRRLAELEPAVFGDALTRALDVERWLRSEAEAGPYARSPS